MHQLSLPLESPPPAHTHTTHPLTQSHVAPSPAECPPTGRMRSTQSRAQLMRLPLSPTATRRLFPRPPAADLTLAAAPQCAARTCST